MAVFLRPITEIAFTPAFGKDAALVTVNELVPIATAAFVVLALIPLIVMPCPDICAPVKEIPTDAVVLTVVADEAVSGVEQV